ncbi:MAG: dethiobiotin synthase [Oscillospiraceae bacterium]
MNNGIFVTGTGTDVGKTYITALLLKKLRQRMDAVYYKAALSGAEEIDGRLIAGDAQYVCKTADISGDPNDYVSYIYNTAVSPHLAAKIEGNPAELYKIKAHFDCISKKHDFVVAEGSGGIVCPIRYDNQKIMLTDIIKTLGLDIIIVSNAALGSINSAVLTCEYARAKGINVRGFILNMFDESDTMQRDNMYMIEQLTGVKILGYAAKGGNDISLPKDIEKII